LHNKGGLEVEDHAEHPGKHGTRYALYHRAHIRFGSKFVEEWKRQRIQSATGLRIEGRVLCAGDCIWSENELIGTSEKNEWNIEWYWTIGERSE